MTQLQCFYLCIYMVGIFFSFSTNFLIPVFCSIDTHAPVRTFEGLPHTTATKLTISRIAGDWYIAFAHCVETESTPKPVGAVGVDLGVKELATVSTGVVFPNPKAYKKNIQKLKRLSKAHSRKKKGSNNRYKSKTKLAKHHNRVANIRKDSLHKVTHYLCKNHAVIVVEDLNVSGMISNHKLAQSIADCGFYEFKRQLEYKTKKFGSKLVVADRWYPSSKTCSNCGCKKETLTLKERVFECDHCGFVIDRDLNAAINLSHCTGAGSPGLKHVAYRAGLWRECFLRDSRSHAPVEERSKV